jgi:C4-dicarboxylate transporter, DctM subunit
MLIPPSVLFVLFGIISEVAIGKLFMAGIIPGLVLTAIYALGIYIMCLSNPRLVMDEETEKAWKNQTKLGFVETVKSIRHCLGILPLVAVTLGGIWAGFFTPTEAGAVGAFGALVLALVRRKLNFSGLKGIFLETGITTSGIFFLLIAAQMYSQMLTISGLVQWLSTWILSLSVAPIVIILMFLVLFLIMGCFIDSTSIMLLTLPLMVPVIAKMGYSLIWFGVVSVVTIEVGLITPPFGMVAFAMKTAIGDQASIDDIFRGSFPFLLMLAIVIALIVIFPGLSTWLPSLM